MVTLTCRNCGVLDSPKITLQLFTNGTEHVRADCKTCGAYIKYLPKQYRPRPVPRPPSKPWELPPMKKPPAPPPWWEPLPLMPFTKELLKQQAISISESPKEKRFLIELKHPKLIPVAERKANEIQTALNKRRNRDYTVAFYSLAPLQELAAQYAHDHNPWS